MSKVKNATISKKHGITFRSKLELYCYTALKNANIKFDYEYPKFSILEPFEFPKDSWEVNKRKKPYELVNKQKVRGITYTPDFTNIKEGWVIECKGNPNDAFPLRWKLFKKYLIDSEQHYDLYMPTNQRQVDRVIDLLKAKKR